MTTNTQLNTSGTPISVTRGGTGLATMTTAYVPICSGTVSTGNLQPLSSAGTSGQVLTCNGASSLPSFATLAAPITKTSVNITTANIHTMYAAPVQILAAQGAHTLITLYNVVFEYIFTTSAFTGGDSQFGPLVQYGSTIHGGGVLACISNMDITSLSSSALFYGTPNDGNGSGNTNTISVSSIINQGLYVTNATAAFVGGGGSMRITLYYSVLSTTV